MSIEVVGHFYAQILAKRHGCVYNEQEKSLYTADGLLFATVSFVFDGSEKIQILVTPISTSQD